MSKEKMQHCDYCGKECGVYAHSRSLDGPVNCGNAKCNREESDDNCRQRDEAHRELDERMGWGRF